MDKVLAESRSYKVYAIADNVYLKKKAQCRTLNGFDEADIHIGWNYGTATAALILSSEEYVILSGCGITFFDIARALAIELLTDPSDINWTNALHQDEADDAHLEFRYVAYSRKNKLRVFRMHVLTKAVTLLD